MSGIKQKILFVNSEIYPYLPESDIAGIGRYLPQGIQERKREIRSFMPRYGLINERKNQLHEVIRLSGMNLIINDVDRPLIIKVASISSARMQVYFIDNDDYFKRKQTFRDEDGKKLRWAPDLIHCHGWISHLVPLYLKKAYRDDPIFSSSKVVLSLYDDTPRDSFDAAFADKARFGSAGEEDLSLLREKADGINLAKTAARYSDGIIIGAEGVDDGIVRYCRSMDLPVLDYDGASVEDGSYVDKYCEFYDKL